MWPTTPSIRIPSSTPDLTIIVYFAPKAVVSEQQVTLQGDDVYIDGAGELCVALNGVEIASIAGWHAYDVHKAV